MFHDSVLTAALDYAGVAVFAATGALAAARRGYDIVTFAFFAAITGIGGGTLRDLLIGAPVFWVGDAGYVGVCIAAAGVVWALGDRLARFRTLLWLDALGLAAYSVVGASKAAEWGTPPLVSVAMGVLTATFGGLLRDVIAGEPSVLLRKEIYVTSAVGGAGAFVLGRLIGLPELAAGAAGVTLAFLLRAGALTRGWTLPGFGPEPASMPTPAAPIVAPPPSSPPTIPPEPPPKPARRRTVKAGPVPPGDDAAKPVEPPPRPRKPRPAEE